jgi:hypothetical protein
VIYISLGADVNELQKDEQQEHDSSYEAEDTSAPNVAEFYYDEISRCMPKKKYFASLKERGKIVHKQKRLLLCKLNEAYSSLKQQYPKARVRFSKFCEIRPWNIVAACGTHSVCSCSTHKNVKLMLIGSKLKELTVGTSTEVTSYKD